MHRYLAQLFLICLVLLTVTLAWDYDDGLNVTGFKVYQWRSGVMQTSPVAVTYSGAAREVTFVLPDADKWKVDWTATAFTANAESGHSNHAGIRPDLPTVQGIE